MYVNIYIFRGMFFVLEGRERERAGRERKKEKLRSGLSERQREVHFNQNQKEQKSLVT